MGEGGDPRTKIRKGKVFLFNLNGTLVHAWERKVRRIERKGVWSTWKREDGGPTLQFNEVSKRYVRLVRNYVR
jgi:hypothetical protein